MGATPQLKTVTISADVVGRYFTVQGADREGRLYIAGERVGYESRPYGNAVVLPSGDLQVFPPAVRSSRLTYVDPSGRVVFEAERDEGIVRSSIWDPSQQREVGFVLGSVIHISPLGEIFARSENGTVDVIQLGADGTPHITRSITALRSAPYSTAYAGSELFIDKSPTVISADRESSLKCLFPASGPNAAVVESVVATYGTRLLLKGRSLDPSSSGDPYLLAEVVDEKAVLASPSFCLAVRPKFSTGCPRRSTQYSSSASFRRSALKSGEGCSLTLTLSSPDGAATVVSGTVRAETTTRTGRSRYQVREKKYRIGRTKNITIPLNLTPGFSSFRVTVPEEGTSVYHSEDYSIYIESRPARGGSGSQEP